MFLSELEEDFGDTVDKLPKNELYKLKAGQHVQPEDINFLLNKKAKEFVLKPKEISQLVDQLHVEYSHFITNGRVEVEEMFSDIITKNGFSFNREFINNPIFHKHSGCNKFDRKVVGLTDFNSRSVWINYTDNVHSYTIRFCIPHEGFHVISHLGFYEMYGKYCSYLNSPIKVFETNANLFAREILLPTNHFSDRFKDFYSDMKAKLRNYSGLPLRRIIKPFIIELSKYYRASTGTVLFRANQLGFCHNTKTFDEILIDHGLTS